MILVRMGYGCRWDMVVILDGMQMGVGCMLRREEPWDMDDEAALEDAVATSALIRCKTITPTLIFMLLIRHLQYCVSSV